MLKRERYVSLIAIGIVAFAVVKMIPPGPSPISGVVMAATNCSAPPNAIVAENCLSGSPPSEWDISGAGDSSIQGFATDISVNQGGVVSFKINTPASSSRLDIYRMGYYGGNGARKVTSLNVSGSQNQPACLTNSGTGLMDCGNWNTSAFWTVPADAVSGIYFARAVRTDTGGASHIVFIVRSDTSHSDILFQTSDTTWQAYNDYGGKNLYGCNGSFDVSCRAFKVSYNRPFHTRVFEAESWVFNAEYPMVRWLEANGYDVSYSTGIDAERNATLIRNHKVWMSNGHDEYWSGGERASIQAARDGGVHLAFFSGNTMFWKTRWENSTDGSNTPFRTMVCYKETHANAVIDPADPPTWTGTWRDPRFSPPADGGRPENALVGTIFRMNGGQNGTIAVPQADGRMRFWRNTSVATLGAGQTATLAPGTIGAEFDDDEDNGFRPAGLFELSSTSITDSSNFLLDYGSTYGAGTVIHKMTLYKVPSGAWVFAAGTYQWSWGLDSNHDRSSLGSATDVRMQQATVNLFADLGVQPASLQAGLTAATASSDTIAPGSTITAPAAGANLPLGTPVTITGTATDLGGGVVAAVEVSVDGGATWHLATGRASWNYNWTPAVSGSVTIKSRSVDDSGNLETPGAGVTVTAGSGGGGGTGCTSNCTIWPATATPGTPDGGPDSAVELGVKFRADSNGTIAGIRFYKASTNTGTHVGNLWSGTGQLLASATFSGETASGWQQGNFAAPVSITANTVYVASYHVTSGHYSDDEGYFAGAGADNPPLHALQDGISGFNGAYAYGAGSTFPSQGFNSSNYWVDVIFSSGSAPTLTSIAVTPTNPAIQAGSMQQFTATGTYSDNSTQNITSQVTWASSNSSVAAINSTGLATGTAVGGSTISATKGSVSGSTTLTVQPVPVKIITTSLPGGTVGVAYSATLAASGGISPYTWSLIGSGALPGGLSLSTGGGITGTPTSSGIFNFVVQAADSATPPATASMGLSITINATPPPLSVTTTAPAAGAGSVSTGSAVSVTFNNALNATTVNASTFTLIAGSASVSGSYSVTGNTATFTPGSSLAASTTYTATLTTGIKDVNGTTLASAFMWTFTTATAAGCTNNCTIWPATSGPTRPDDGPDSAVELGVRFRADSDGRITGIRFYKATANTGTHIGNLWSNTGQLLASATFTGETGSGWQQVSFSSPVSITANTVYVASYHTSVGHYADDQNFFATAGVDNAPLHAIQDGISGFDGAYAYGAGSTFPNQGFNSSNYWVDVVFSSAPALPNTGLLPPAANAPVTTSAGDNNGFETTPANALTLDGAFAVDANSGSNTNTSCTNAGKDKHDFFNYNVSLPAGAVVQGIEVRLDAKANSTANAPMMCAQLSWDGGVTWTATQSTPTLTTATATYILGGSANTWGRAWAIGDLSNGKFRIRIIDVAASTARTFSLDWIAVRVTYQ